MRSSLFHQRRLNLIITFFIFLSIALMFVDHKRQYTQFIRSTISSLLYPIQYLVTIPQDIFYSLSMNFKNRADLISEIEELKGNNFLIRSDLENLTIIKAENDRLRELLKVTPHFKNRTSLVRIVSVDMKLFRHQVIIDKGEQGGAYVGQPIIDANGILGQIIEVNPFVSRVLLITDPSHAIPVHINRNGVRAIAVGLGQEDQLALENLNRNADVIEGDLVVSSGLGGRFPKDYPVGYVSKVHIDDNSFFARVEIKSTAKLRRSREVLMVWKNQRR